ncbi:MAG: response regulator [Chloroflexota bacterium]
MTRILYIEDDPIQQTVLSQMLEIHGFDVEIADDGLQGVEKAQSLSPDLIITDSKMPRMSGLEAIATIRNVLDMNSTPIIALSARADDAYKSQAREAGADEVFTKPVDLRQLTSAINSCLEDTQ